MTTEIKIPDALDDVRISVFEMPPQLSQEPVHQFMSYYPL